MNKILSLLFLSPCLLFADTSSNTDNEIAKLAEAIDNLTKAITEQTETIKKTALYPKSTSDEAIHWPNK